MLLFPFVSLSQKRRLEHFGFIETECNKCKQKFMVKCDSEDAVELLCEECKHEKQ